MGGRQKGVGRKTGGAGVAAVWEGSGVWTRDSNPQWDGVTFGDSKTPGIRRLRIGLKNPIAIGSVLVRGGGQLSVLKPNSAYPGNLANDADWLPAERLKQGQVISNEVGRDEFAVWVLPPGTTTRALRFTHNAELTDNTYAGCLGAAMVLSQRLANVAPAAVASASNNNDKATLLNNEYAEGWGATWDNAPDPARS